MSSRQNPPDDGRVRDLPVPPVDVAAGPSGTEDGRIVEENGRLVEPDRRQMPPPAEAAPGPQIVTADTVRSAPLGWPVLVVLAASLVTAAVVLGTIWTILT